MLRKLVFLFILSCSWVNAAPVNINVADADLIAKSLSGIGPSKAAAIVKFRNDNGPFKSIEELKYVKGVGDKILNKNREDIVIVVDNN